MLDPALLFISSIAVANIILALVLLVLGVAYVRAERRLMLYKLREQEFAKKAKEQAYKTEMLAENRAERIVSAASEKAAKIISDAEVLTDEARKNFAAYLKTAQETIVQRLTEENIRLVQDIVRELKQEAEARREKEFQRIDEEIRRYKDEQLKLVQTSIDEIVQDLARKILGRSISLADHEDLTMEALEKAKRKLKV
jgi:F0F1-type ATP synthase membrane subunit b/b'